MNEQEKPKEDRIGLFQAFCEKYANDWDCLGLVFRLPDTPQTYKLSNEQARFFNPVYFKAVAFIIIFPHSALSKHACEIIQMNIKEISQILIDVNKTLSLMLYPDIPQKYPFVSPKLHEHQIKSVDHGLFRSRILSIFGYKESSGKRKAKPYNQYSEDHIKPNVLMEQMMEWKANKESDVHRNAKKLIATIWYHQYLGEVNLQLIEENIQRLQHYKYASAKSFEPS